MSDASTTVGELRAAVGAFVRERAWEPFHTPKNLAMSVAIEAAEVMELFQWLDAETAAVRVTEEPFRTRLGEELADVCCYVLSLANRLDLDLSAAIRDKLAKNTLKYPAADFHGRYERPSANAE